MPIARFQMPDGKVARFEVPDGTTPEQAQAMMAAHFSGQPETPKEPSALDSIKQGAGNLAAGAVRGAGSIGATILSPLDAAARAINGGKPISVGGYDIAGQDRRGAMDAGLQEMGAQPDSLLYKGGKIGAEIAGTAGAGGLVAKGLSAIPALAKFAPVVESGGFNIGNAGTGSKLADALTRFGGGAVQGGTQAAMVDPNNAVGGAAIGAVVPGSVKAAGAVGSAISNGMDTAAHKLMQSALKPTIEQLRTGKAATAIQTLLDEGINATRGGVDTLRGRIGGINDQVSDLIKTSTGTVSKQKVIDALNGTRQDFAKQVSPTADMNAINGVADDFSAHPLISGDSIPVQLAQQLKQGTYAILNKKYGQVGSAETEAQKALARGLKEGVADAAPEISALNAQESKLITTLGVTERRALMDANKNPMGLAILAHDPATWAAFMADKSALFKSLAARMANSTAKTINPHGALPNLMQNHGLLGAPSVALTSSP